MTEFTREIVDALGAQFAEDEIEFLPRATSGGRALGLAYIDARTVMRRLDAVVGPSGWSFDFDVLSPDGKMVKGRLTVLGVTKCDAGEANAEDEPLKSAVSDTLKRCAVHFGIGRYLYYLPRVWAPFDNQKRQFVEPPRLAPAAVARALEICGISSANVPRVGAGRRAGESHRATSPPAAASQPAAPAIAQGSCADDARSGARSGARSSAQEARERTAALMETHGVDGSKVTTAAALVCSRPGCGCVLKQGQHASSMRAFGVPLCPAHQREERLQPSLPPTAPGALPN